MITRAARAVACVVGGVMSAAACTGSSSAPLNMDAALADASNIATDAGRDVGSRSDVGRRDAGARSDAGPCRAPRVGLQQIVGSPASPYYVHHPTSGDPSAATVIFIGGGTGGQTSAQHVWELLARDSRALAYRVVLPYSVFDDFIDEAVRTYDVLDEVLECFGGDPARVHVAGRSNGGYAAFALMLGRPERFVTLLGAPGLFPRYDPDTWGVRLAGKSVVNGVGELDDGWIMDVQMTQAGLLSVGVDSIYVEFPGETHSLSATFDPGIFFDFWDAH